MKDVEGMEIYKLKGQVNLLYTITEKCYGTVTIRLLKFLYTLVELINTMFASKDTVVCTINYYLEYEAKEVHEAHMSDVDDYLGVAAQSARSIRTW